MKARALGIAALLALNVSVQAADADETRRFYGYAYDLKTHRYLYTEVYEQQYKDGNWIAGRIRDYLPDGKLLADKTLDFSKSLFIPVYRMEIPGEHYVEAITEVTPKQVKLYKLSDGKTSNETVDNGEATAGDSGFNSYLLAHFDALMKRETVAFKLIVAGNLDSFQFRAQRIEDSQFEGRKAVRIRVEPSSLLRYLVSPLELSYDPDSKRLLEYRGISNMHDPVTHKAFEVQVIYPSQPPADAPKSLPPLGG